MTLVLLGNYGYTSEYARDAAYQRTLIVYEPAARNYSIEVWGKNLLDELYVNGGFGTRDIWGDDFNDRGPFA
jgi:hypothetical protein